ncbi:MAG: LicD family protein, partial [Bacteroidales bacterium]|nr:LicD family protein [Bacteroidales bacterium]
MATYEIRPLQMKILEILQAVDKTCKEYNLRYYLTAGTMLGAVRHKGFIPWDDDADIAMPRPDYERVKDLK